MWVGVSADEIHRKRKKTAQCAVRVGKLIEDVLYTHILYPKLSSMTLGTALVLKWSVCNREVISVVHQVQGDIPKLSINLDLISFRRTSCGLVFTVIRDKVSRRTSRVPVIVRQ